MDCRKLLLLATCFALGAAGCITQERGLDPEKPFTTIWTPLSCFQKDVKRKPQVETCTRGGQALEKQAAAEANPLNKEHLLQQARKAYLQALAIEPDCADGLLGLARVYYGLHEYDEVKATYAKATKLHPENAHVWCELGLFHFRQHRYEPAATAFRKAYEAESGEREYGKLLSVSLALAGNEQDSLKVLAKMYGGEAAAHFKYAFICLTREMNQPEMARHHLQVAIQCDPMYQDARTLLTQLNQGPAPAAAPALGSSPAANLGFRVD